MTTLKNLITKSDGIVVTGGIYLDGSGGTGSGNKLDDYEQNDVDTFNGFSILMSNIRFANTLNSYLMFKCFSTRWKSSSHWSQLKEYHIFIFDISNLTV